MHAGVQCLGQRDAVAQPPAPQVAIGGFLKPTRGEGLGGDVASVLLDAGLLPARQGVHLLECADYVSDSEALEHRDKCDVDGNVSAEHDRLLGDADRVFNLVGPQVFDCLYCGKGESQPARVDRR